MASEEMPFENVDGWTTDAWLYYKLTYEPSAQVRMNNSVKIQLYPPYSFWGGDFLNIFLQI